MLLATAGPVGRSWIDPEALSKRGGQRTDGEGIGIGQLEDPKRLPHHLPHRLSSSTRVLCSTSSSSWLLNKISRSSRCSRASALGFSRTWRSTVDAGGLCQASVGGLLSFIYPTLQLLRHGVRLFGDQDLQSKVGLLIDYAGDQDLISPMAVGGALAVEACSSCSSSGSNS